MSVLLIAEHNNKELKAFTLNAVTAASHIDSDVHALIIGNNCGDAAKAASELPLVKKVITVEAPYYENFIAENYNDYYTKALSFYENKDYLSNLRKSMRDKVLSSPLFNNKDFASVFSKKMKSIWENFSKD